MSKSRKNRRGAKQKTPRQQPTAQARLPHQPISQAQPKFVKRIAENPLILLAGMVGIFITLSVFVYKAVRSPEIILDPVVDPLRPFAFPFIVKNKSWFFEMRNTAFYCGIDKIKWQGGGSIAGMSLVDGSRGNIAPGKAAVFRCSIGLKADKTSPLYLTYGHITPFTKYRTLWFERESPFTDFTWTTEGYPPHWVEGKPTN